MYEANRVFRAFSPSQTPDGIAQCKFPFPGAALKSPELKRKIPRRRVELTDGTEVGAGARE